MEKPNIFNYHDYRAFIADWLPFMKSTTKRFSLRKLAEAADLSPALLSLVMSKKRTLTERAASQLAPALGLNESEQAYFGHLARLSEAPSQEERTKAYQSLQRFQNYRSTNQREIETFNYLSKWYYVAIRELAAHPRFSDDPEWIQNQLVPKVALEDIRAALKFLFDNRFLEKKEGRVRQTQRNVECMNGVFQLSLNQFHKQILELAIGSIDEIEKEKRNLTGYSFFIRQESYPEIVSILEEAMEKLKALEARDLKKPEGRDQATVYHAELIAFPMTGSKR